MHPYVRLDEMWQSEYVLLDNVIVPFMLDMTQITWLNFHVISFSFDLEIRTWGNLTYILDQLVSFVIWNGRVTVLSGKSCERWRHLGVSFYPDPEKLFFCWFFFTWKIRFFLPFNRIQPWHLKSSVRNSIRINKHHKIRIKTVCHVYEEIIKKN